MLKPENPAQKKKTGNWPVGGTPPGAKSRGLRTEKTYIPRYYTSNKGKKGRGHDSKKGLVKNRGTTPAGGKTYSGMLKRGRLYQTPPLTEKL